MLPLQIDNIGETIMEQQCHIIILTSKRQIFAQNALPKRGLKPAVPLYQKVIKFLV